MPFPKLRRRHVIAILLGLVLGLVAVFFLSRVYNPWEAELADPLVLVPDDVDFVVCIEDLPQLVEELESRPFVQRLREHGGAATALGRDPDSARLLETIGDAVDALRGLEGKLPFGLEPFGEVTGRKLVLAAFAPEAPKAPWRWFVVAKPESWLSIAGANIAIDEQLAGWFLKEPLGKQGVRLQNYRDSVAITVRGRKAPIHLTRIADAVVISSEGRALDNIARRVAIDGLPSEPPARVRALLPGFGSDPADLWVLARREKLDRQTGFTAELRSEWGPEIFDFTQRALPPRGGEDLMLMARVGLGLELELRMPGAASERGNLFALAGPQTASEMRGFVARLGGALPGDGFATLTIQADPGRLAERLFETPGLVLDEAEHELLDEELGKLPSLGGLRGLYQFLSSACEPQIGAVFFTQPRDPLPDASEAGRLFAFPIRDRDAIERLLAEITERASGGGGAVRSMERVRYGEAVVIRPVLAEGTVEDSRLTVPGLAFLRGYFLVTDYLPWLEKVGTEGPEFAEQPGILEALSYAPPRLRAGAILDARALFTFLDQSKEAWAVEKTTANQIALAYWRMEAQQIAANEGLRPASIPFRQRVDAIIAARKKNLETVERERLRERYRRTVDDLRGMLTSAGLFVNATPALTEIRIRLDLQPNRP